MPIVETSVAVATPSITALRMTKGSSRAGSATRKARPISRPGARFDCETSARRERYQTSAHSMSPMTSAGRRPPWNSAAIETPVTEPIAMRMRLGGTVSVCAPVAASKAASSALSAPRFSISGNNAGATAAMSAAFDPEMPDTRYMAATST